MKVYAIHSGSVHEGGGVDDIYAEKETAIKFTLMEVEKRRQRFEDIHGKDDPFTKAHQWKETIFDFPTSFVKRWSNGICEVVIYEYDVK